MSQLRPFFQAVCQKKRENLEWYREATLEKEHFSQGNKREDKKSGETDREACWWTVFPICTYLHEKRQQSSHQFNKLAAEWTGFLEPPMGGWGEREGALQPLKWSMSSGLVDRARGKHFDRGCQTCTARSRVPILTVALHQTGKD